jgi:hypothetical protein
MSWFSEITSAASRMANQVVSNTGGVLMPADFIALQAQFLNGNRGKTAGVNPGIADSVYQDNLRERDELTNNVNSADIAPSIKQGFLDRLQNKFDVDGVRADLAKAKNNEGNYGTLNKNYHSQVIFMNRPGATQLFASGQSRASAQSGILSTSSPNGLAIDPAQSGVLARPNRG